MTRVDFYILGSPAADARLLLACRLAEKAFQGGHVIYIQAEDAAEAEQLDALLWTFRAGSFVPHRLAAAPNGEPAPVLIGHAGEPQDHTDVLINLAAEVPLFFSRFARVAEVVGASEQGRDLGRERYRFYRERGYPLETHNLD